MKTSRVNKINNNLQGVRETLATAARRDFRRSNCGFALAAVRIPFALCRRTTQENYK